MYMFVQDYSMRFHIVEPSTRGLKCCEASKNEPIWRVIFLNHQPAVDPTKVGLRLRMKSGTISVRKHVGHKLWYLSNYEHILYSIIQRFIP